MARDSHIIRPDRLTRPGKAAPKDMTREERISLLVLHILSDVRIAIEAKKPLPRTPGKR